MSVFPKMLNILYMFCMVMTDDLPLCCWLCSSQAEANQFTGMVYQGLLLSERKRLRTESIEEHITPNSAPAQWPGNKASDSILKAENKKGQIYYQGMALH